MTGHGCPRFVGVHHDSHRPSRPVVAQGFGDGTVCGDHPLRYLAGDIRAFHVQVDVHAVRKLHKRYLIILAHGQSGGFSPRLHLDIEGR